MKKILRPKKSDFQNIIDLRLKLLKGYPAAFFETYEEASKRTSKEWRSWLNKYLNTPNSNIFVAKENNQLVGMVLCRGAVMKRASHITTLEGLGVLPTYAGQGIGQALIKKTIDWLMAEAKILRLQVDVYTENKPAIKLYQKMGFKKEGIRKMAALNSDGSYQDILDMVLFL